MSANRGKWAEDKVREWLNKYKGDRASFTFNRILDAHSAKGAMSNPQAGDFQWFMDCNEMVDVAHQGDLVERPYTRNGLIEVKTVEHAFRLPYKNFTPDQVGRMRIRKMAGSECIILVAFRPAGQKPYWSSVPLEFFEQRDLNKGSWDLTQFDAFSHCDDLLEPYLR